jgi:hypothetical protein
MKQITRDEFIGLVGNKYPLKVTPQIQARMDKFDLMPPQRENEREWWVDGPLAALIIEDVHDQDWAYVILGPDPAGDMRAIDLRDSLASQDIARVRLHAKMAAIIATGQTVFEQD